MTKYNLTIYKNISRACTVFLSYVLAFITVLTIYEKQIDRPYYLLGIPAILIGQLLIQRYCFHVVLYFLLHFSFLLPICLIPYPNICYKVLYIILFIIESGHACYIWKAGGDQSYNELPWYLFLFVSILYIAGRILKQDTFANCVYYIGLAQIILHFIRYFIYGLSKMFEVAEHTTTMPTKKIMLTSMAILGMLLFFFFVFAISIQYLHLDQLLYLAGDALTKLLQVLIRFFLYVIAFLRLIFSSNDKNKEPTSEAEELTNALQQLPKPSVFAEILTIIIEVALAVFAFYVLYRFLCYAIRILLTRYTSDSDIVVSLHDKTESVHKQKTRTSLFTKIKEQFDSSYRAKIRRIYKIQIRNYKNLNIRKDDTPTDIASQVQKVYDEDIDALTQVYEKARYSNEEITAEDAHKGGIL